MVLSVFVDRGAEAGWRREAPSRSLGPGTAKVFGATVSRYPLEPLFASCVATYRAHGGALMVTSKAEEYRAKALECEERAEQTRDPYIKQRLIEIAEKWRHMAAYLEKNPR